MRTRTGLAAATLCAAAALGTAPAAASVSTAAAKIAPATQCFYVEEYHITTDGLRIHQYPATGSPGGVIFGLGYTGQEVISRRVPVYNAGLWWVYGTDQSTGVTGWMAKEYLQDNGNIGTCLM